MDKLTTLSRFASEVDDLGLGLTLLCAGVTLGLFITTVVFCWRFHASRTTSPRGEDVQSQKIEVIWTSTTLFIFLAIFVWATQIYRREVTAPEKADYNIFVLGKRWMWKVYHPTGHVEVNHISLPRGKTVRLTMISKDVIHSFFLPGLRTKQDVLPGRYTTLYLRPDELGTTSLYCAEYCGSSHSKMVGKATVLEEDKFKGAIHSPGAKPRGVELFERHGCINCHSDGSTVAPSLIHMAREDEDSLRRSILYPKEKVDEGFDPVMPSYLNALSEEDLIELITMIKSKARP